MTLVFHNKYTQAVSSPQNYFKKPLKHHFPGCLCEPDINEPRAGALTRVLFTPKGSPLKCHQTGEDSLIVLSRLVWALHKTVLLVLAKLFNRDKAPCHFSLTPPNSFKCHQSAVSWCRLRQHFLNPVTLFGFLKRGPWLCFCLFHPPLDGIRRVGFRSPTRFSVCRCLFPGGKLCCTAAPQEQSRLPNCFYSQLWAIWKSFVTSE